MESVESPKTKESKNHTPIELHVGAQNKHEGHTSLYITLCTYVCSSFKNGTRAGTRRSEEADAISVENDEREKLSLEDQTNLIGTVQHESSHHTLAYTSHRRDIMMTNPTRRQHSASRDGCELHQHKMSRNRRESEAVLEGIG